jgi:hypothetical protein
VATPPPAADSKTVTPPPAADARTATPLPGADAGAQGTVVDVGASTSPPVIDVDPISVMPSGTDENLIRDQAQIEQASKDLGLSGA